MNSRTNASAPNVVFKARGNPARLTLVRPLQGGERCVCDLVASAGLGWSTTSKHLDILREAGVGDFIACLDGSCARTGA